MGHVTREIAVITEPEMVSLVALPNFVQFESKPHTSTKLEVNIKVSLIATTPSAVDISLLKLTDYIGTPHTFKGTTSKASTGGDTFYISALPEDTAENMRNALLSDRWIAANFDITIPFVSQNGALSNGPVINIRSKGAGEFFNVQLTAPNDIASAAYSIDWVNRTSISGDSISGEGSTAEIELDVYTNTGLPLGESDPTALGRYVMSVQKTYAGAPLWFDLNAIFKNSIGYNRPGGVGWFDTGTVKDLRFVAYIRGVESYPFYLSDVLYLLRGRAPLNAQPDLSEYVFNGQSIKLLTNKPRTTYRRGQKAYLNFIFGGGDYEISVAYSVYTQSGRYLGTEYAHQTRKPNLSVVNTCVLDIEHVLDKWPRAGRIKVSLARDGVINSDSIEYEVLPECLHTLNQFSFINALGGWDCFNFDAPTKTDLKQSTETYEKTLTPDYTVGDGVELIYTSDAEKSYTVESAPMPDEVAAWLEELAAATVVLDGRGRYVLKDEFNIQVTDDKKNMQKATLKYRLSE